MTKVHELLAVEKSLADQANVVQKGVSKTLNDKREVFVGMHKTYTRFNEDEKHLEQADEIKEVTSTVDTELDFLAENMTRYWDCYLQKESANQSARADIIIGGKTIAKDIPSIVLLSMEKKLSALLGVYSNIPTLDASVVWEEAASSGAGIYQTKHPVERMQQQTTVEWKEISKATDKHPAQLKEIQSTTTVGKTSSIAFAGFITSADKAERIMRLQQLIRAVKQARQRANECEVDTSKTFGAALFDFINKG